MPRIIESAESGEPVQIDVPGASLPALTDEEAIRLSLNPID
jgi:hypothetical protein